MKGKKSIVSVKAKPVFQAALGMANRDALRFSVGTELVNTAPTFAIS